MSAKTSGTSIDATHIGYNIWDRGETTPRPAAAHGSTRAAPPPPHIAMIGEPFVLRRVLPDVLALRAVPDVLALET